MRCMIHPDIKPEMTETSYVELDTNTEEYITRSHDGIVHNVLKKQQKKVKRCRCKCNLLLLDII